MTTGNARWKPETLAIALGRGERIGGAPLNVPIVPASNFRAGGARRYARDDGAPGWGALEEVVGALEGGVAVAFASGMAAIAAIFDTGNWSAAILPSRCYAGVRALARERASEKRFELTLVDAGAPDAIAKVCAPGALLWLESPTNPLLEVLDLARCIEAAHAAGAAVAVDNTFATPLLQTPLAMGADYVVHSATKYLSGHSDALLGVLICADDTRLAAIRRHRMHVGAIPGVLESFLVLRGIRTLPVRLAKAQANARVLAERLAGHPAIECVRYPGFGAMIAFDVRGGADAAQAACNAVVLIAHATSLGGVESSMERRQSVVGDEYVPAGLIRLSVGCEDVDDLWADLDRALR